MLTAIGVNRTAVALALIRFDSMATRRKNPDNTNAGPKSPAILSNNPARAAAPPVSCMAMPRARAAAIIITTLRSMARPAWRTLSTFAASISPAPPSAAMEIGKMPNAAMARTAPKIASARRA